MGLPIPGIHLPQRKPKNPNATKVTVQSVEGTLRHLEEKELLLQTSSTKVLRFRLIPRTEFRGKDAKPIRDSLLHPGDRITIDANPDDLETALHVILVKSGSDSDLEKAGYPVEESKISTPASSDFGKPHSVTESDSGDDSRDTMSSASDRSSSNFPSSNGDRPSSDDGHPTLSRKSDPPPDVTPKSAEPQDNSTDAIIADARAAASSFSADLPNFLVQQVTTRYAGSRKSENFRAMDVVTADVSSVNGKEEYKNIRVNGKPTDRPEDTGSWSTGEFKITLEDILSPRTAATFTPHGDDRIRNRSAWVFDVSVDQPHSHWTIMDESGRKVKPAYKGTIWIDKESRRVLRIEQEAVNMPRDFAYDTNDSSLEYGFVNIDGHSYLLPVNSVNEACGTGTSSCSRNVIQFKNYRKFGSDSSVSFQ
jgi:hypothetical protein